MRIVFAGTPSFAQPALIGLLADKHEVIAVLTQPDRRAGRGQKLTESIIKTTARNAQIPVFTPSSGKEATTVVATTHPDIVIVVAYGLLLPAELLRIPPWGCLNIHASLLPRWRGAAPIARAIEAGDTVTGITIMQMDEGLDTGPILAQTQTPIGPAECTADLTARMAELGAHTLRSVLQQLATGNMPRAQPQPLTGVSYARKLRKDEAPIRWQEPATVIAQRIRALSPWPGSTARLRDHTVKIGDATIATLNAITDPGQILALEPDLVVATGQGSLTIKRVQEAGGKPQIGSVFARTRHLRVGDRFD